jgi:hypothetical protein
MPLLIKRLLIRQKQLLCWHQITVLSMYRCIFIAFNILVQNAFRIMRAPFLTHFDVIFAISFELCNARLRFPLVERKVVLFSAVKGKPRAKIASLIPNN